MLMIRLLFLAALALAAPSSVSYQQDYKKLETAKDWAGAKDLLARALKDYPTDAWLNVFMGFTLLNLKKPAEALPFYEKAYAADPTDKGVRDNYAAGLSDLATDLFFTQHKFDDACPLFQKATQVAPDAAGHYNSLGNCWRETRHFKESYDAFSKFYSLGPQLSTQGAYKENFRAGVLAGVDGLNSAGDRAGAKAFAELGLKAYPDDRDIRAKLIAAQTAAGDTASATKTAAAITDPAEKALLDGLTFLQEGKATDAEAKFKAASAQSKDPTIDDRIAKAYRSQVEALTYDKQMASPLQAKVVVYATNAVKKYFARTPYHQAVTVYPPLVGPFCVGQGAGGKSFHYGLERHYSWDLMPCDGSDMTGRPVLAVADGVVIGVLMGNTDNAKNAPVALNAQPNVIRIQHGDVESQYYHLRQGSAKVRVGQAVKKGQQIALVGNSGVTTGPHLHFMMMKLNQEVTVPVAFTGLYSGPRASKPGTALKAASTLDVGPVYSTAAKL